MKDVLLLLSGGIDSIVLAAHSLDARRLGAVLIIHYDQPNAAQECAMAREWAKVHHVDFHELCIELPGTKAAMAIGVGKPGLREVPGRNLILLAYAVSIAKGTGLREVWLGATKCDAEDGYGDCTPSFVRGMDIATEDAYGVNVYAPFEYWGKEEIVKRGRELGVNFDRTWSCYEPVYNGLSHASQCGECNSCKAAARALDAT